MWYYRFVDSSLSISIALISGLKARRAAIESYLLDICTDPSCVHSFSDLPKIEIKPATPPDIFLLDLPNVSQPPVEAISFLKKHYPPSKIIVTHFYEQDILKQPMLKAGADAYLNYELKKTDLVEAIKTVCGEASADSTS
ncbi:MAG: hypothetical protein ACNA78_06030 [Balneolaceae bacterium]